jgi:CDP-6-deoxy-D-xylo-4-hexulose-3-dehydrase
VKMSTIDRVQLPEFDCECSWFGYALVVEDLSEEKREHLAERLLSAGIETRPILSGNFLKNPVISHLNYEVYGPLTIADKIDEAGLFFGAHCYDLRPEIEAAGNILKEFLDEN